MVPSFRGFFSRTRVVEATSGLRQSIRLTQQRAANRGEGRVMTRNLEAGTYSVLVPEERRGRKRERAELLGRLPEDFWFAYVYFPETEELVDRRKARLEFFPDGTTHETELALVELDRAGREKGYYVITIQGTTGHVGKTISYRPDQFARVR